MIFSFYQISRTLDFPTRIEVDLKKNAIVHYNMTTLPWWKPKQYQITSSWGKENSKERGIGLEGEEKLIKVKRYWLLSNKEVFSLSFIENNNEYLPFNQ